MITVTGNKEYLPVEDIKLKAASKRQQRDPNTALVDLCGGSGTHVKQPGWLVMREHFLNEMTRGGLRRDLAGP